MDNNFGCQVFSHFLFSSASQAVQHKDVETCIVEKNEVKVDFK